MGSLDLVVAHDSSGGLNLKETELRLGLPGRDDDDDEVSSEMGLLLFSPNKINNNKRRSFSDSDDHSASEENSKQTKNINFNSCQSDNTSSPTAKAQIVGWPPVRSTKKNSNSPRATAPNAEVGGIYVKVSMDGAPYLRKIDLKGYKGYNQLLKALENMFNVRFGEYTESEGYKGGSTYAAAYEDGDGDMMLVGDVPWGMFMSSCKRFRIMKASEAKGMGY